MSEDNEVGIKSVESIISPCCLTTFMDYFSKKVFLKIQAENKSRFQYLMPWSSINNLLEQHRLSSPRIRLFKKGKLIDQTKYTKKEALRRYEIPYLDLEKVNFYLNDGASMIINSVDEVYKPLTNLVRNLEHFFQDNISVNAYLSFGNTEGFNPHWDDHDVFILQVYGKKKWFISPDTWPFPMSHNFSPELAPPPSIFESEHIIEDGDFLYIPRGWWHFACSLNEPSLHLTFGITSFTGSHFLEWISKKACDFDFFRRDVPKITDKNRLKAYYEEFKQNIKIILEEDLLGQCLDYNRENLRTRSVFSLPISVVKNDIDLNDSAIVGLCVNSVTKYQTDSETKTIKFVANQKEWIFPSSYKPLIDLLLDYKHYSFLSIKKYIFSEVNNEKMIKDQLIDLIKKGLIFLVSPNTT